MGDSEGPVQGDKSADHDLETLSLSFREIAQEVRSLRESFEAIEELLMHSRITVEDIVSQAVKEAIERHENEKHGTTKYRAHKGHGDGPPGPSKQGDELKIVQDEEGSAGE